MTSREIVSRAIEFKTPPRLPFKFEVFGLSDCYDVWTKDTKGYTFDTAGEDEWGCVWQKSDVKNMGRIVRHPLAQWEDLEDYRFPDPGDPRKFEGFEESLGKAGDKLVMFCIGHGIFERSHTLRGFQQALEDLYVEPERYHELLDRILDFHISLVRNVAQAAGGRVHAVALADDWGTERDTIISRSLFQEFFKPRYKKLFDVIHGLGMHTWMHSCGRINGVLDDLIDAGLDVINSQQPLTTGIDDMAREFAGRICFESIVDTQLTYPTGTYDEIRAQAKELVEKWSTPQGGFIVSDYNDFEGIGTTLERRRVCFEAFCEAAGIDPDEYPMP